LHFTSTYTRRVLLQSSVYAIVYVCNRPYVQYTFPIYVDTYIYIYIYTYIYSLLHLEHRFFNLKSQSMFSTSLHLFCHVLLKRDFIGLFSIVLYVSFDTFR